jgi:hypothetical protein
LHPQRALLLAERIQQHDVMTEAAFDDGGHHQALPASAI